MFRAARHPCFALLLLLCLGRTLLPETWVLAWHPHVHTTHEPAYARRPTPGPHQLLFTAQHQHCHAEQFYNVPFALGSMLVLPRPRVRRLYPTWAVGAWQGCPQLATLRAQLRGPPRPGLGCRPGPRPQCCGTAAYGPAGPRTFWLALGRAAA